MDSKRVKKNNSEKQKNPKVSEDEKYIQYDHLNLKEGKFKNGKLKFALSKDAVDYIKKQKRKLTNNKIDITLD